MFNNVKNRVRAADRYLMLALALAAAFALYGIWWGWVESWNPDDMAFRSLFAYRVLEPFDFQKPPFHTYVNFILSVLPFKILTVIGNAITGTTWNLGPEKLWWSRLIQISFFLGIIYLSFKVAYRFAGSAAARIVALITATSAGLLVQTHFLTADVPVTFWMLASFYAAQSIVFNERMRTYVVAGLLVGIATATKYNGLAVGLAIPVFHFYAHRDKPFWRMLFEKRLVVGVAMVVVGFIAANPYAILDYPRFAADFAFNYAVTPVYGGGESNQYGFGAFLLAVPDIIGWPVTLVIAIGAVYAIGRLRQGNLAESATVAAALAVFALYFIQFGRAPRIEVRFVVPVVIYLLIASASFWSSAIPRYRRAAMALVAALIVYNAVACFWVGKRFAEDPRMQAQAWVAFNVPAHSTIESTPYVPHWNLYWGVDINDVRSPVVSGRAVALSHVFKSNESMMEEISRRESDAGVQWYKPESLKQRDPQFVALDSMYFNRFLEEYALDYPRMQSFVTDLLANRLGYHKVYDRAARSSPIWLYPREITYLDNEMVILRRDVR